jgi:flagellar basal-body rod protein FlgF
MISGLYSSASCLLNAEKEVDLISANLANCSTPAYKQSRITFSSFPDMMMKVVGRDGHTRVLGKVAGGAVPDAVITCFRQGDFQRTGSPTDFAIDGEGFFQVQTDQGVRYTRNGSFHRDVEGILRDGADNPVIGANGIVRIGQQNFTVNQKGEVIVTQESGGVLSEEVIDRIETVDIGDKSLLLSSGGCRFELPKGYEDQIRESSGEIRQNFLEDSNMTPIHGLIQMMSAFRAYESSTKMLDAINETFQKSVNEVANANA